jgi:DNA-3-methyladenine glycosylase
MSFPILNRSFYLREDVVQIARDLLGKYLVTRIDGLVTAGMICETEAYAGVTDRASHAFGGRRTARTEVMYAAGGTAYVYLCYGIHSLFNIVTNAEGIPHAVLVRGIIPAEGEKTMRLRAEKTLHGKNPGIGPGKVSKLLGIHYCHTGLDLTLLSPSPQAPAIRVEDRGIRIAPDRIEAGPRIGVDYAGVDALLPYRFNLKKKPGAGPGFL